MIDPNATTPPVDPELEKKRQRERIKKQNWRLKVAGQSAERDPLGEKPKPRPAPMSISRSIGPYVGPMGTGEARRTIFRATVGVSRVMGSQAEWDEHEFEEAGDAFTDIANHFWPLRLALRLLAPLILLGALVIIGRKMIRETPWWQARQARKRQRELELQAEAAGTTAEQRFADARDGARRPASTPADRALGRPGGPGTVGTGGHFSRRR